MVELGEDFFLADLPGLVVDLEVEAYRGHELVEQAREGVPSGVRGLGEDALLGLRENVGFVAPHALEEVATFREIGGAE